MSGKTGFRVRAGWPRPSAELIAAFGEAASSQVADAMSRLGGMDFGVRAMWPLPRTIGAAVTVWSHAGDNIMYHKAISLSQPGDILVINTQGSGNAGWGELLATSAMKTGIRGGDCGRHGARHRGARSHAPAGLGARPLGERL